MKRLLDSCIITKVQLFVVENQNIDIKLCEDFKRYPPISQNCGQGISDFATYFIHILVIATFLNVW